MDNLLQRDGFVLSLYKLAIVDRDQLFLAFEQLPWGHGEEVLFSHRHLQEDQTEDCRLPEDGLLMINSTQQEEIEEFVKENDVIHIYLFVFKHVGKEIYDSSLFNEWNLSALFIQQSIKNNLVVNKGLNFLKELGQFMRFFRLMQSRLRDEMDNSLNLLANFFLPIEGAEGCDQRVNEGWGFSIESLFSDSLDSPVNHFTRILLPELLVFIPLREPLLAYLKDVFRSLSLESEVLDKAELIKWFLSSAT